MDYVTKKEMQVLLRDITKQNLGYEMTQDQIPKNPFGTIVEWYKCGTVKIRNEILRRMRNES